MSVVTDRRLEQKPFNGRTAERDVADPFSDSGGRIVVTVSTRDDPLSGMKARRHISECQYQSGRRMQEYFEAAEIGSIQATDPGKEFVDGRGQFVESITDRQQYAVEKVNLARAELGRASFDLVRDILMARQTVAQAALARGVTGQRRIDATGTRFRGALDELAELFGLSGTAPRRKPIHDKLSELAEHSRNPKLHAAIRAAKEAA